MALNASQGVLETDTAPLTPPYSLEIRKGLGLFIRVALAGSFALFGIVSNIINIKVFYRQGILSHSSIVSLTALAVSDLLLCMLSLWLGVCSVMIYAVDLSDWSWHVFQFSIFTGGRPLNFATNMTCLITTFTTVERLVSVVFPFKVKAIFSPKKSMVCLICMYVGAFLVEIPNLTDQYVTQVFFPHLNRTKLGFTKHNKYPRLVFQSVYYARIALRFSCIITVGVCNLIIFSKVKLSQKFRNQSTNQKQSKSVSPSETPNALNDSEDQSKQSTTTTTKEMKLMRMVTAVATMFFICYVVDIPAVICLYVVFQLNVDYHWNIEELIYCINYTLQTFNSSANFIIYLTISSAYRQEFQAMFNIKQKGKEK